MSGQIPAYGAHFRRVKVTRDYEADLSSTAYVSKRNPNWVIRSNGNSEKWWIFYWDMVVAGPFPTFTEAGNRAIYALWELYAEDNESLPKNTLYGRKNSGRQ